MPRGIDPRDSAYLQGRLWTPAALRPAAWYDAADLSTLTIATGASEWRDKSGNARHATQATAANQPLLNLTEFNGLPSLYVSVDGGHMAISVSPYTAYPVSIISAIKLRSGSAQRGAIVKLGNSSTGIGLGRGSTDLSSAGNNMTGIKENVAWITTSTAIQSSAVLVMVQPSSGSTTFFQNGSAVTITAGASNAPNNPSTEASIFGYIGAGNLGRTFQDYVGEVVLTTSAISTYERQLVEGYLGWKWKTDLAADHPFANRPPLIGD